VDKKEQRKKNVEPKLTTSPEDEDEDEREQEERLNLRGEGGERGEEEKEEDGAAHAACSVGHWQRESACEPAAGFPDRSWQR
jgi:hypothetical protein